MWCCAAGGENIFGARRQGYLELDLEAVQQQQPNIFLLYAEPEFPVHAAVLQRERGGKMRAIQADITPEHNLIHDGPAMMLAVQWLRAQLKEKVG